MGLLARRNEMLDPGLPTAARMVFSLAENKQVQARIMRFRPDVIHVHNAYPGFGPAVHMAAQRLAIPLVMTVHNLRLRCPNGLMFTEGRKCRRCESGNYANAALHRCFPSTEQAGAYAIALWTHRFVLHLERMVDVFIAPSEFIRGALERWGIRNEKTRVVRNFAPLTRNVSRPLGAFGVYIGRLSAEKGVETLLRSLVAAGDPSFRIVGDGPLRDSLTRTATELGLQRTIFTGFLSSRDVESMLEGARFLAMHSLSDENAPVAVMEAMAAGRPVVVTSNGGLPELVRHGGGLLSEPGDAETFGEHIRLLMNDDDECSRLGAEARRIAEEDFVPERHLALLEAAYDLAIARRRETPPASKRGEQSKPRPRSRH